MDKATRDLFLQRAFHDEDGYAVSAEVARNDGKELKQNWPVFFWMNETLIQHLETLRIEEKQRRIWSWGVYILRALGPYSLLGFWACLT